MTRQKELTITEWQEVARLLYEAEALVMHAGEMVADSSRKTDPASTALWQLVKQMAQVRMGPCEERFFREHSTESRSVFCGQSTRQEKAPAPREEPLDEMESECWVVLRDSNLYSPDGMFRVWRDARYAQQNAANLNDHARSLCSGGTESHYAIQSAILTVEKKAGSR